MGKLIPYLFVFAGLVLGALALPSVVTTLAIARDVDSFATTRARVLSQQERSHGKGPKTVEVKFEFETGDGRTIRGDNRHTRLSDDARTVDRLVVRSGGVDRIQVWYDATDPTRHVISRDIDLLRPLALLIFIVVAVFGGGHAIVIDKRRRALQARADADRARREAERAARRHASANAPDDGGTSG